jgi:hypothetical protein
LFCDNVNKRLGVGNNAPIGTIHALSSTPNSQIILQNSNNAYTISSSFNFVNRFQLSQNSDLPIFNIGQSDDTVTRGAIFEFFGKGFGGSNNVEGLRFLLNNPFGITGTQNIVIDSHGGGNGVIRNIELRTQNNNNQFILFTSGNACINQSTDAGFRLDVNGTTRFQGNSQITGNLLLNTTVDSGDRLRVNGTVRIDSVTNATGDIVTIDANNVLRRRTSIQLRNDINVDSNLIQDLGNISGTVNINLALGTLITATLTGTTTLTFSGLPPTTRETQFKLRFSGNQTINFPSGTLFPSGIQPTTSGVLYELSCSINSSGQLIVYNSINDIRS